jgi:glycosyltransferase involved in cell wall biosynthesis
VTRVLVICSEPVGERMAGPAIRALELSRALSERCEVTLAAPPPSDLPSEAPMRLLRAGLADYAALAEAMAAHDVVVAQALPAQLLRHLAGLPARYVADLYNVLPVEVLEAAGDVPPRRARRSSRQAALAALAQCAAADLVVCASEKQRDFWLGAMTLQGLIGTDSYRRDPSYRSFVDVVPFGVSDREPRRDGPALKGVWPGIGASDHVLLWSGGLWRWLDALTPIRAVQRLRAGGLPVHLVFLGMQRPGLEPERAPSAAPEAIAYARERGLEGECVHFNDGWVPYEQRDAYLLDADIGVSAHKDHLESRFSFRTRALDHLWAGLPTVATAGDAVSDLIERHGAGRTAPFEDDAAFADACAGLLRDSGAHRRASASAAALGESLRWSRVTLPLVDYCVDWRQRPVPSKNRLALLRGSFGQYPHIAADLRERHGTRELLRRGRWYAERVVRRVRG